MRKAITILVVTMFLLMGCSGIQIVTSGSGNVMIKIASIKLGGEFAKKNSGEIDKVNSFAKALEGDISTDVYEVVKNYLTDKISSDPVDQACLNEILNMIKVEDSEVGLPAFDNEKLKVAIEGFLFGMNIGG
jgi:hypothetical protein